ncbi:MAG: VPS10 domain-containing protein [Betaproteobacteria bacterium]
MKPGLFGARFTAVCAAALTAFGLRAVAQAPPPERKPAPVINRSDDPLLRAFTFRSIGPANIGGRIDDIAVIESHPSTIYLGFATGGVFKTVNNGTTWTPIFETYSSASIGDIAVSQRDPNLVWVGTGEANNRQSSTFGDGIYKSTDGGKTFENMGLKDSQSIARIVIDPRNDNVVYVAVAGHLFGPNPERGLYKTSDGGKTWIKSKFIDDDTGFTDVAIDPNHPDTLFAASYQRRRTAWGFNGGGPGSAIWKTTNAGRTWTKLTGSGLPDNPIIGRIGLDVSRSKPGVVMASIEVGASGGTGAGVNADGSLVPPGTAGPFGGGGEQAGRGGQPPPLDPGKTGVWRSEDGGRTWKLTSNTVNRPMYYSQIRIDPSNDQIVYQGGAPFYKSVDGGRTFKTVEGVAHSDHHAIWIDPHDTNHVIIGNDGGIDISYDQCATWEFVNNMAVGLFYAVSADMRTPYYVCGGLQDNGSWCGPSSTRSTNGIINEDWYRVGGGDGFYTQNDPTDWATVYAESQDGNTNRLDLRTGKTVSIRPRGQRPPQRGAQAAQAEAIAEFARQAGFGGQTNPNIVPLPPVSEQPRFYWNTPVLLSPHNPDTVYVGGDRLYISRDRGNTYTRTIDLTNDIGRNDRPIMGVAGDKPMASKHDGAASYSNIVTISESPVLPGILWVGTNDGNLQVSRDGGTTWTNVAGNVPGVPRETHVSRVEAGHFDAGTCYVTFDGHRTDDMKPYVFVTHDFGQTWTSLAANLPMGNVNVIREDPVNKDLLFLGTEYSFYVSLDGGRSWKRFLNGLPTVRVDDILIHPRDHDLIVGTHGRSIWIMDDITPLEALAGDKATTSDVHLFSPRPGVQWIDDITLRRQMGGQKHFEGENAPRGTAISYYLKSPVSGDVTIAISDIDGKVLRELKGTNEAGINRVQWDLRGTPPKRPANLPPGFGRGRAPQGPPIDPGTYLVKLSASGKQYTTNVVIEPDPMAVKAGQ